MEADSSKTSIFQHFVRTEALSGLILLAFAALALVAANSPLAGLYTHFWETSFTVGGSGHLLTLTLHQWINDGLMAVFFLLVGLEIKRELVAGELSSPAKAALPIVAALGGVMVPALLYWACNAHGPGAAGWGIPMATDIAFALGVLALVVPDASVGLKVFLAALAIVDDMVAVLVIAIFYSGAISWAALGAAGLVLLFLITLNLSRVTKLWPYLMAGAVLWYFIHESGMHATIAGVLLAMTIPARTRLNAAEFSEEARDLLDKFDRKETGDLLVLTSKGQAEALFSLNRASEHATAPIQRLEHALHRFSAFAVMPLFAFANAGVSLGGPILHHAVGAGVLLGLVLGKPLGITAASFLAVKSGLATLPAEMRWGELHGAAWLAGIGFTMSLFISMLAFADPAYVATAKVAILGGSLVAGIIGAIVLRTIGRRPPA